MGLVVVMTVLELLSGQLIIIVVAPSRFLAAAPSVVIYLHGHPLVHPLVVLKAPLYLPRVLSTLQCSMIWLAIEVMDEGVVHISFAALDPLLAIVPQLQCCGNECFLRNFLCFSQSGNHP